MKFDNKKDLYDGLEIFLSMMNYYNLSNGKCSIVEVNDICKRFECDKNDVEVIASCLNLRMR
jgi:hypothetical protein